MFSLERFCQVRPYVYHLTSAANLTGIALRKILHPAAYMLRLAGEPIDSRRTSSLRIHMDGTAINIRDQGPSHLGAIDFDPGWDLSKLVEHINNHVFFWPGKSIGPIEPGINHYKRYAEERLAILKIQTSQLFAENPDLEPLFCPYNSGAPRRNPMTGKCPRGQSTYLPAASFSRNPSEVVELVFKSSVQLPACTIVANSYAGPWRTLIS